jgi:hypothetical protein
MHQSQLAGTLQENLVAAKENSKKFMQSYDHTCSADLNQLVCASKDSASLQANLVKPSRCVSAVTNENQNPLVSYKKKPVL